MFKTKAILKEVQNISERLNEISERLYYMHLSQHNNDSKNIHCGKPKKSKIKDG